MRFIYREEHIVYVDHEIELSDEELIESGVNPHDNSEIKEHIKLNFNNLNPDSTEWWVSLQNSDYKQMVGIRPGESDSEQEIEWIE